LLEAAGLRIGVVACADHFEVYGATGTAPGIHLVTVGDMEPVRAAVAAARAAGADLVVFSIHWGPNMRQAPTEAFRRFARAVMDAGADIFHGHSAHVFQGIEIYRGKPILYDTGDLLDDYRVDERVRNDQQLLFLLTVVGKRVTRIELVPLKIRHKQVNLATGADLVTIRTRMRHLCAEMGTRAEAVGTRLIVAVD
jgi:poly-gamma-glutamate synthesis protein (capsule biosynthesis protein)